MKPESAVEGWSVELDLDSKGTYREGRGSLLVAPTTRAIGGLQRPYKLPIAPLEVDYDRGTLTFLTVTEDRRWIELNSGIQYRSPSLRYRGTGLVRS